MNNKLKIKTIFQPFKFKKIKKWNNLSNNWN